MKQDKLVCIIMPVYNGEKTVEASIDSVLKQTYKNFELIIVDDFSSDNSVKLIKKYNDSRICLIVNNKNCGAAYSRNLAIEKAKGDYIAFLDSDDLWDETKLEEHLEFMINNNISFSYTPYRIINSNGEKIGKVVVGPKRKLKHKDFIKTDFVGCLTVIYKREICPLISIPDIIKKRNDYACWIEISKYANCVYFNKVLSSYRLSKSGLSSNKKKLIHYHYFLFREFCNFGRIHSFYCTIRNILYYLIRKVFYVKKSQV